MEKLPISVGILTWNSPDTLFDTLNTYKNNGLLDIVNETVILCQEVTDSDIEVANNFSIPYIIGVTPPKSLMIKSHKKVSILLQHHVGEIGQITHA
jgi:hypothetical protein